MVEISIKLPLIGSTARLLTINFVARLANKPRVKVRVTHDKAVLSHSDEKEFLEIINGTIQELGKELKDKIMKHELRDMPVHKNDYKLFSKLLGRNVGKGSRFSDVASEILSNVKLSFDNIEEWSKVSFRVKGNELLVILGSSGDMPLPQPLLTERFESSHMFMRGIGGKRIKIRGSREWIILLLAGYALSYAGIIDDIIHFIHASEDIVRLGDKEAYAILIDAENGLIPRLSRLNIPAVPKTAYMLYLASQIMLECSIEEKKNILKHLLETTTPQLEIERIRFDVNTYTMVERFPVDLHQLISKLSLLKERTVKWINSIAKTCLLRRKDPSVYTLYSTLVSLLYNALSGAGDIMDATYYASRVVLEKEVRTLEAKNKHKEAVRLIEQYKNALKDLISVFSR